MKFVESILKRPVSVIMLILAVVVFGGASLAGMPLEYMPDMEMPMELVMIVWPGADADSIDRLVTQPIEDECETLSDVKTVSSYTFENYAMISVRYNYGTDLDDAYSDLKNAMDNLMSDLPEDCEDPTIIELSADFVSTMMISAVAPEGIDVASYLNDDVVPELESLSGVAMVEVTGAQDQYIRIVLDEAAMRQYGLSISTVGSAIAAADFDMPVGSVSMGTQDIALSANGSLDMDNVMTLQDLPIQTPYGKTVKLGDVATFVNFYREEADSVSRYNGNDSVLLAITKQDSASTVEVCNTVLDLLDTYSVDGVSFEVIYSEGEQIINTLGQVLQTLIVGILLTMLVIFLFFGEWRASIVVAFSMPLSILMAVMLLNQLGYAIDLVTGTSLIIAIGMIVDNSIVILESCMRSKEEGLDFRDAATQGTSTMLMSILAGTLTTVVVYIPLAMAEGMTGMMSGPLSWTILLTMISSFICAVVVVPLAFVWLKPKAKEDIPINRLLNRFKAFYRRVMPRLLRHPGRVVAAGFLCLAASLCLMPQMEFVLIPNNYDGSIALTATFRSGTKLETMDEQVRPLEEALLADENFENVTLSISDNSASFTAYAADDCKRSSEEAVEYYTNLFNGMAGMDVSVTPTGAMNLSSIMSGNSKEISLTGDDLDTLEEASRMVEEAMTQVPGVIRISNDFDASEVKGKLVVDSQKALALGTSEASVAGQIYYALNGLTATSLDYDDTEYDVVLELPEGKYDDISALLDYPIVISSTQQVALRELVDVEYTTTLSTIHRQDGKYMTSVSATTTDAAQYTAADAIDEAVAGLSLPQGVSVTNGWMDDTTDDEVEHILTALGAAIFLVFLVMAIQFDSPKLSIMVMTCIPLSLIGSIVLMYLTGRPMSLMGLMGFLMLVGISVNNGIYLVDGTNQLRQTMSLGDALIEAGTTRLRPILMTTLTTAASMISMLFSKDAGMGMMKDMAYIIIGGLIVSTIMAMFLIPAFYLLIQGENLDGTKRREKKKQAAEVSAN